MDRVIGCSRAVKRVREGRESNTIDARARDEDETRGEIGINVEVAGSRESGRNPMKRRGNPDGYCLSRVAIYAKTTSCRVRRAEQSRGRASGREKLEGRKHAQYVRAPIGETRGAITRGASREMALEGRLSSVATVP